MFTVAGAAQVARGAVALAACCAFCFPFNFRRTEMLFEEKTTWFSEPKAPLSGVKYIMSV
jgi:hypothetical protein